MLEGNPILNNLRLLLLAIMGIQVKLKVNQTPKDDTSLASDFFINTTGDLIITKEGFKQLQTSRKF